MLTEPAPAKLNLALHVRGRRDDGYHELDTLFAFVDQGDVIGFEASTDLSLAITGPHGDGLSIGPDNLVLRAAHSLQKLAATGKGARLTLDKRLPLASGIGGGSADAAATLRLLDKAWRLGLDIDGLMPLARELGSDVPACLLGKTALATGRGDVLNAVGNDLANAPVLLVNPGIAISTPEIFSRWGGKDGGPLPALPVSNILGSARNDLAEPASAIAPQIAEVLETLLQTAPVAARMSGSGATCFAIFDAVENRDHAHQAIIAAHPHWWTMACRLT